MRDDFAVFIITHKREKQPAFDFLRSHNYTGKIYFLCDDMDNTRFKLIEQHGEEMVVVFNKKDYIEKIDLMTNKEVWATPVFVENFMYDFAEQEGIKYFVRCDDDITKMSYCYAEGQSLKRKDINNLDGLFEAFVNYMEQAGLAFFAPAQAGAYVGGVNGPFSKGYDYRYAQMTFCDTDYRGCWKGYLYSDYCNVLGTAVSGRPAFRTYYVSETSPISGGSEGGMREAYDMDDTNYIRNFLPVMFHPSSTKIDEHNGDFKMSTRFENVYPKIISDRYKK